MSLAYRKEYYHPDNKTKPIGQYEEKLEVKTTVKLTPENSARETRTNQAFKKPCDINHILARFRKTGVIEHVSKYEPQYGELSVVDFEDAFNTVKEAQEMFDKLPADIRANFHNKPENFLSFMEAEENRTAERLLSTSKSRNAPTEEPSPPSGDTKTTEAPVTEPPKT